jgi:hypothetical protein
MSQGRPVNLPDFRKPPVRETVLSLQFEPIEEMTAAHVGLLWQRFRKRLPFVEEHPPLPAVVEKFGLLVAPEVEVTIGEKPPVPRMWFLNTDKTELIQVQVDRFIRNWRKVQGEEIYPRYEKIRARFADEVAAFQQFLADERFPGLSITQCEVTYINHIEPAGIWEHHGQIGRVLKSWLDLPGFAFLPAAEDGAVRLRFLIPGDGGTPVGRLHLSLQPARKKEDNSLIFSMNLTARGAPLAPNIDGAFAFFDLGREWIVRGFADLTTPEMHRAWERLDV